MFIVQIYFRKLNIHHHLVCQHRLYKECPAVHDRGRSLPLSPAEEPSQFIGQNAVTQILTVLETMRDENREMKRMLHRLLARSATDDEPMQLPSVFRLEHLSK
ncbi:hypothetical protein DPMN_120727 [Dreissena polymorpha]|uniref:Uncharacterized protein n=1 Tax=Dreissena polymorpha TaxID=45954 RepID=A0A9D4GLB5_DREPO|nr:hypothetical protein DPMN_120727 [Dreissena polymorpha]